MPAFRALFVALTLATCAACSHSDTSTASSDATSAPDAAATDLFGSVTPGPDDAAATTAPDATAAVASPGTVASAIATTAVAATMPAVIAAATPVQAASSLHTVAITDISGLAGESQIKNLAALGVVEPATGAFHPQAPLTRATFVRWLVKANNVENTAPTDQIRLAEGTSDVDFVDVPPSNPDYRYIQGMADAGFVIGIDAKHFAPARNITREEMIAIYMNRVVGGKSHIAATVADTGDTFTDVNSISKPYWGAFNDDNYSFFRGNIARTFGAIRTLHPQRPATREEAAIMISVIEYGDAAKTVTAAQAPAHS